MSHPTLDGVQVVGSAMTQHFVRTGLRDALARIVPPDSDRLARVHTRLRHRLGALDPDANANEVLRHVLASLCDAQPRRLSPVRTREGREDGGHELGGIRGWAIDAASNLDTPTRAQGGRTRSSQARGGPTTQAQRVLRAKGERLGLLANGDELRLLICDPSMPDSHLGFALDRWRDASAPPACLDLLLALTTPQVRAEWPSVMRVARTHQTRVTDDLRRQARAGLELFLSAVVGQDREQRPSPAALWHDGLILIHRLLFVLKLEASDPALGFSFASTRLWREVLSPSLALGPLTRRHLDQGHDTGSMLETGLRQLFRACRDGLTSAELVIAPLGGALFDTDAMPILDRLPWGDRAVAVLLDRLLWTEPGSGPRERIHYGSLDVEVLGSVYESLLELEPGIATRLMIRRRRGRQDTVIPAEGSVSDVVEAIPPGRFFLRHGQGRKTSGSYYTPTSLVRFLVRATLEPSCSARSPMDDPNPLGILALKVVDPAMGSGHFLVEACRFLADALLDACQRCLSLAGDASISAERSAELRGRIAALPDPDRLLDSYLARDGIAEARARAICRRMVAMHCLYGVDRNPLAVELAKLSLWLESHADGLPLTFLDHRMRTGDSLAGPFLRDMHRLPVGGGPLDPLLSHGLADRLDAMHRTALAEVRRIGATLGRDLPDIALKRQARQRLAEAQSPLIRLAQSWAGAAMMADRTGDDEWLALAHTVVDAGAWPKTLTGRQAAIWAAGRATIPWDLVFPEAPGFDAVIGNPPWDVIQHSTRDFAAEVDPTVYDARTPHERARIEARVLADPVHAAAFAAYRADFEQRKRIATRLYHHQRVGTEAGSTAGNLDAYRLFAERAIQLAASQGAVGLLLPSAFHGSDGATGVRRLYLDNGLHTCLSLENRASLFDIDSRFKFALVVARRPDPARLEPAAAIRCAFYLHGLEDTENPTRVMTYDRAFIRRSGGSRETFLELRGSADLAIARRLFGEHETLAAWCTRHGIRFGRDLHMTDDAHRFTPVEASGDGFGWLTLHEGKSFHQFTDRREPRPRYAVHVDALADKPRILTAASHMRLAFRDIARSNDERSMIATMLPANTITGHTVTIEKTPERRPISLALMLCAIFNSFPFDWLVRQKAATHLSLYLLDGLPFPHLNDGDRSELADIAAALCATDPDRADRPGDHGCAASIHLSRWLLRARADALVARGYGLGSSDYAHLLAVFSHASWPEAPVMCMAAFRDVEMPVKRPSVLVEAEACSQDFRSLMTIS